MLYFCTILHGACGTKTISPQGLIKYSDSDSDHDMVLIHTVQKLEVHPHAKTFTPGVCYEAATGHNSTTDSRQAHLAKNVYLKKKKKKKRQQAHTSCPEHLPT